MVAAIAAATVGGNATAGTPRCGASTLALSVKNGGGGLGHQFYLIRLRNKSRHSCKLGGYPGVSLLNASHRQMGRSAKRDTGFKSHLFTLRPGQTGVAALSTVSDCAGRKSSFVRVIPPNTRSSLTAKLHATTCSPTIQPLHKSH